MEYEYSERKRQRCWVVCISYVHMGVLRVKLFKVQAYFYNPLRERLTLLGTPLVYFHLTSSTLYVHNIGP